MVYTPLTTMAHTDSVCCMHDKGKGHRAVSVLAPLVDLTQVMTGEQGWDSTMRTHASAFRRTHQDQGWGGGNRVLKGGGLRCSSVGIYEALCGIARQKGSGTQI